MKDGTAGRRIWGSLATLLTLACGQGQGGGSAAIAPPHAPDQGDGAAAGDHALSLAAPDGAASGPCPDPSSMPADYPPYDGTAFFAAGAFHNARGPNLETTGFRIDYGSADHPVSAEIDMQTLLHLNPEALFACNLLLDSDPTKEHVIVSRGYYASACGTFIRRRKIVVATQLIDMNPGSGDTGTADACAKLALAAVGVSM